MIQRLAAGSLNESVAERPTERWHTGARTELTHFGQNWLGASSSGLTAGAASLQLSVKTTPGRWRLPRWVLDTNVVLDPFAGSGNFFAGSYTHSTAISEALDLDIVSTLAASSSLLGQVRPYLLKTTRKIWSLERDVRSSALFDQRESSLVPYLALVRSALERDDLNTARMALDAVPLNISDELEVRRLQNLLAPPRITVSAARDVDRTREYRWFRNHWQDYRAQWVALDGDRVLAAASSLKELRETLKQMNLARPPLLHRVD